MEEDRSAAGIGSILLKTSILPPTGVARDTSAPLSAPRAILGPRREGLVINGRSLVFSRFAKVDKIKFQLLKYYFSPSLKNKNCSLASNQVLKTEKSAAKLQRRGRTTSAS